VTIRIDVGKVFFGIVFLAIAIVALLIFIVLAIASLLLPIDLHQYNVLIIITSISGAIGIGFILLGINFIEMIRRRK